MGLKKDKNEKKSSNFFLYVCGFFVATYGNEVIFVGGLNKNTDLRNYSRLSKHYTKPDEMCPRWAKYSTGPLIRNNFVRN